MTFKDLTGHGVVIIGCIALSIFLGFIYGEAAIKDGDYMVTCFISAIFGAGIWCLLALSRLKVSLLLLAVVISSVFLTIFWGHYVAYNNSQNRMYMQVQKNTNGSFDTAWKDLDRDEHISHKSKELHSSDFFTHLWLTANEGAWFYDSQYGVWYKREGFWMWWAWLMHILIILTGAFIGFGARIGKKELDENTT